MANVFIRGDGQVSAAGATNLELLSSSDFISAIDTGQYPSRGIFLGIAKSKLNDFFNTNYGGLNSSDIQPNLLITNLVQGISASDITILETYTPETSAIETQLKHYINLEGFATKLKDDVVNIFRSAFDVTSIKIKHRDVALKVLESIQAGNGSLQVTNIEDIQSMLNASDFGYNHTTFADNDSNADANRTPEALFLKNDIFKFQNGVKFYYNFRIPDYNPKEIYDVSTLGSYITADSSGFKLTMRHAASYTEFKVEMRQDLYIVVVDNPFSNLLSPLDSDDTTTENTSNLDTTVTGTLEKGIIVGATIDFVDIRTGETIKTTTSGSDGSYISTVPSSNSMILVRARGGTDIGTTPNTVLSDTDVYYSLHVFSEETQSTFGVTIPSQVNITLLTSILYEYVQSDPNYSTKTPAEIQSSKDSATVVVKNVLNIPQSVDLDSLPNENVEIMKKTTELYAFAQTSQNSMSDEMDTNDNIFSMVGKALRDVVNESADPASIDLGSVVFRKIATNKTPTLTEAELNLKDTQVTTQFNAVKQAIINMDSTAADDDEKTQNYEKLVKAVHEMYHASDSSERNDSFSAADLQTKTTTLAINPATGRPKVVYSANNERSYPLYKTEASADYYSSNSQSITHIIDGVTYYMPAVPSNLPGDLSMMQRGSLPIALAKILNNKQYYPLYYLVEDAIKASPVSTSTESVAINDHLYHVPTGYSNNIQCLNRYPTVNTVNAAQSKYIFNDILHSENDYIGVYKGSYKLNIPENHPMGFVISATNTTKFQVSTTGATLKGTKEVTEGGVGYAVNFYSGTLTIVVKGDFGVLSYYCFNHGYMGGQYRLKYSTTCANVSTSQPEPEPEPVEIPVTINFMGTVREGGGAGISSSNINVYDQDNNFLKTVSTNSYGVFDAEFTEDELAGVERLKFDSQGGTNNASQETNTNAFSLSVPITVSSETQELQSESNLNIGPASTLLDNLAENIIETMGDTVNEVDRASAYNLATEKMLSAFGSSEGSDFTVDDIIKVSDDSDKRSTTDEIAAKLAAYNSAAQEATSASNNSQFNEAMAESIFPAQTNTTVIENVDTTTIIVSSEINSKSEFESILQKSNISTTNATFTTDPETGNLIAHLNDTNSTTIQLSYNASDSDANGQSTVTFTTKETLPASGTTSGTTTQSVLDKTSNFEEALSSVPDTTTESKNTELTVTIDPTVNSQNIQTIINEMSTNANDAGTFTATTFEIQGAAVNTEAQFTAILANSYPGDTPSFSSDGLTATMSNGDKINFKYSETIVNGVTVKTLDITPEFPNGSSSLSSDATVVSSFEGGIVSLTGVNSTTLTKVEVTANMTSESDLLETEESLASNSDITRSNKKEPATTLEVAVNLTASDVQIQIADIITDINGGVNGDAIDSGADVVQEFSSPISINTEAKVLAFLIGANINVDPMPSINKIGSKFIAVFESSDFVEIVNLESSNKIIVESSFTSSSISDDTISNVDNYLTSLQTLAASDNTGIVTMDSAIITTNLKSEAKAKLVQEELNEDINVSEVNKETKSSFDASKSSTTMSSQLVTDSTDTNSATAKSNAAKAYVEGADELGAVLTQTLNVSKEINSASEFKKILQDSGVDTSNIVPDTNNPQTDGSFIFTQPDGTKYNFLFQSSDQQNTKGTIKSTTTFSETSTEKSFLSVDNFQDAISNLPDTTSNAENTELTVTVDPTANSQSIQTILNTMSTDANSGGTQPKVTFEIQGDAINTEAQFTAILANSYPGDTPSFSADGSTATMANGDKVTFKYSESTVNGVSVKTLEIVSIFPNGSSSLGADATVLSSFEIGIASLAGVTGTTTTQIEISANKTSEAAAKESQASLVSNNDLLTSSTSEPTSVVEAEINLTQAGVTIAGVVDTFNGASGGSGVNSDGITPLLEFSSNQPLDTEAKILAMLTGSGFDTTGSSVDTDGAKKIVTLASGDIIEIINSPSTNTILVETTLTKASIDAGEASKLDNMIVGMTSAGALETATVALTFAKITANMESGNSADLVKDALEENNSVNDVVSEKKRLKMQLKVKQSYSPRLISIHLILIAKRQRVKL